jgi:deoxyribose-phosphate aldolase
MYLTLEEFRKRIEYSLVNQFASKEDIRLFCERAMHADVGVACVNPVYVSLAAELLGEKNIELSASIGFPFGSHKTEVKVLETRMAVEDGTTQIDMVINVGALRSKEDNLVQEDIQAVVDAAQGRVVKAIIETWVLNNEEKKRACRIAEKAGVTFVKTTTGVRTQYLLQKMKEPKGAVLEDIILMRKVLGEGVKIKASGGVYTLDEALQLLNSGADHLGMSEGAQVIEEFKEKYGDGVQIDR